MASRLDSIRDWDSATSRANFRVDLLASSCGVTERQLRRYILQRFGKSPHAWMMSKRLEKAFALLANGKLVKEAAAEVGFIQPSNLTRQFKRQFNRTPTSLRLH